ncbi:CocE/NonD family hydrolase [Virgibacillus siamensis]|uniref:CocE/NonD family hydrolase n=1 Tax=Virgibacillus siamensis TaxID=480071 RepID=UPI0009851929|nr:CocE/NonD family hydrolase [Virgibacillus siamensis]
MQIILDKNVACTLRDGTVLYADIYRPGDEGTYPVLLTRLPYGKDLPFYSHRYLDTNRLVQNGYVVIIQDVRGRFESEGNFIPFINEAKDGYDTVEWAASLPYSSGKVGMFGLSYYGFTQLAAAAENPPHLKAIFPSQSLNDPRRGNMYHSGAYGLGTSETWALESIVPDMLKRKYGNDTEKYREMMLKTADYMNHIHEWYHYKPINEWPPLKELRTADYFFTFLDLELNDSYWEQASVYNRYEKMNVPAYHVAGWYDSLLQSTLDNYVEMNKQNNQQQKLIIGPWAHGDFKSVIGERNFGVHASEDWIDLKNDLTGLHIDWFNHWLKDEQSDFLQESPVKLFVMGSNEWRNEQEWPLARTQYTPFYLHSRGQANRSSSDGTLSFTKPEDESFDSYIHNPENPVPTVGGGTLYDGVQTTGPHHQGKIEDRDDVLIYTSKKLEVPVEVTGPINMKLWASTDAPDTDFTAKLVDVFPDGTAINLTDGIVRARYRNGYTPEPDLSGEIVKYEIDLWATSNVFLPGHQIRIEIASSNFPRFDVNPNTGKTARESTKTKLAQQTIYHNTKYPSHIVLPIIPTRTTE